jgi:transposase, IS30 family
MPKGYHHMTREQRCQIEVLRSSGFLQKDIARQLHMSASTISREIKRNSASGKYAFNDADLFAVSRHRRASAKAKRMTIPVFKRMREHLGAGWSPEQISGRLKMEAINISHESIYKYIWKDKRGGGDLYKLLRHGGKKYNKRSSVNSGRGCIPNRIDIKERPEVVETKTRIGDWEGDTIIGAKHKGAILSYVDRRSKLTILEKLPDKTAENVVIATIKRFSELPYVAHTITLDNGKEFCGHEIISKQLEVDCYFATPYHSWERGLNEHTNGLVRQYVPKSSDILSLPATEVKRIEELLNNRPRKVLEYRTPKEEYLKGLSQLATGIALQS